jgi:hypothetical protein
MAIELNHTIINSTDPERSATWLAEVLGLDPPVHSAPFWEVRTSNAVNLDFHHSDAEIAAQHYAFLITEEDFDAVFARLAERGVEHFADPAGRRGGEINHHDGGRGMYFSNPDGHWMEVITRPYGSGG